MENDFTELINNILYLYGEFKWYHPHLLRALPIWIIFCNIFYIFGIDKAKSSFSSADYLISAVLALTRATISTGDSRYTLLIVRQSTMNIIDDAYVIIGIIYAIKLSASLLIRLFKLFSRIYKKVDKHFNG